MEIKKWEKEFDEHFQGFLSVGDPSGGYECREYIKNFIQSLLDEQLDEIEKMIKDKNRYSSEELRDAEWVVKDIVEDLRKEDK